MEEAKFPGYVTSVTMNHDCGDEEISFLNNTCYIPRRGIVIFGKVSDKYIGTCSTCGEIIEVYFTAIEQTG